MIKPDNESLQRELALLCQDFYPETISTGLFMTELMIKLSQAGYHLRVYCTQPVYRDISQKATTVPNYMEYEGIKIFRVPTIGNHQHHLFSRALFSLSFLVSVTWAIFRDRASLQGIIVSTSPPFIGLAAWLLQILCHIPYTTIIYDVYPDVVVKLGLLSSFSPITWLWERLTRLILNHSQQMVVIGRDMLSQIKPKINSAKQAQITLIPNWANEQRVYPIPRTENRFIAEHQLQNKFVVQYSGRMGRVHTLLPLLDAAEILKNEPILFQFIGDGAQRQMLQIEAYQRGLKNLQFLPYQPLNRLAETLSAADIGVVSLTPRFTGLSVPSKSYGIMASGTPILALLEPTSEIGLMVEEANCGIVLPNPTGQHLADTIQRLRQNPSHLQQMGRRGRAVFLQQYTLQLAAEQYNSFFKDSFYPTNTKRPSNTVTIPHDITN